MGISKLNVALNNFKMARLILVIRSSNDAALQKEFGCKGQAAKLCFTGVINKISPLRGVLHPKYSIP
jgi:hypothetical protein